MPPKPDADPKKLCQWCGTAMERKRFSGRLQDRGAFLRQKFCSISCATSHQHSIEAPTVAAARKRAQKQIDGCCEICGASSRLSVHHCDENPKNNRADNLQTLCLTCHGFWHGAAKRAGISPAGRMPPIFRLQEK